jgi:hypothetical protein
MKVELKYVNVLKSPFFAASVMSSLHVGKGGSRAENPAFDFAGGIHLLTSAATGGGSPPRYPRPNQGRGRLSVATGEGWRKGMN